MCNACIIIYNSIYVPACICFSKLLPYTVRGVVYLSLFEILRVVLAPNNRLTVFAAEEKRLVVTATLTGSCLSGL